MNTKSILHYGQMVCVMLLFTIAQSCSEVVLEDPVLPAGADSSLLTKASNPVVEFVADSVSRAVYPRMSSGVCVDLYGNIYYTRGEVQVVNSYSLPRPFYKYNSDSKTTSVLFQALGDIACVDGDGNVYHTCKYYNNVNVWWDPTILYKRDSTGNLLRNFSNFPQLNNPIAMSCDINNNIYVLTNNIFKIAFNGRVSAITDWLLNSPPFALFSMHKAKGQAIFLGGNSNEFYAKVLTTGETSQHASGIPHSHTQMGCGMNDAGLFLLSYNTIHRLNPNNNQVIQKAVVPTSVMKDGVNIPLGPISIYPTPDGNAVYVLCDNYSNDWEAGSILIKITF